MNKKLETLVKVAGTVIIAGTLIGCNPKYTPATPYRNDLNKNMPSYNEKVIMHDGVYKK